MGPIEAHLDNLCRHVDLVRAATILLGKRLIKLGDYDLAKRLVYRGYTHDSSKFLGIEWSYLHAGREVPKEALQLAIHHHQVTNDHHPEYWGNFEFMSDDALAEMVCDMYARSQEFATNLRDWIMSTAVSKYKIDTKSPQFKRIVTGKHLPRS